MNPREFLVLAQTLVNGTTQAEWRSSASRAYYAAFHVARELLTDLGFAVPPDKRAHAYLWLRLSNAGDPAIQQAGATFRGLRQDRSRADYDLHRVFSQALASAAVRTAQRVLQALAAAASGPIRTQITDAMRVYERDVLKQVTWHP